MERSVAYSLVRRRDFKAPDGNEKLYYATGASPRRDGYS